MTQGALLPSPGCTDQAIRHHAKKEVDQGAKVNLESMVARNGRQRGHKQEVGDIAQDDREQSLQKIHER